MVSTAVAGITTNDRKTKPRELVDIVVATILYFNVNVNIATMSIPGVFSNADFLKDATLTHCRMSLTQPGRVLSTTRINVWTRGHHFCSCLSFETIPAMEVVVTFRIIFCKIIIYSVCIRQSLVMVTYISWQKKWTEIIDDINNNNNYNKHTYHGL